MRLLGSSQSVLLNSTLYQDRCTLVRGEAQDGRCREIEENLRMIRLLLIIALPCVGCATSQNTVGGWADRSDVIAFRLLTRDDFKAKQSDTVSDVEDDVRVLEEDTNGNGCLDQRQLFDVRPQKFAACLPPKSQELPPIIHDLAAREYSPFQD